MDASITLTAAEANDIADALLAAAMALNSVRSAAEKASLEAVSAGRTFEKVRDAMLMIEGRLTQTANSYADFLHPDAHTPASPELVDALCKAADGDHTHFGDINRQLDAHDRRNPAP